MSGFAHDRALTHTQVFDTDIRNLLIMADMWKSRSPPTPLDFDAILNGTFQNNESVNGREGNSVNGHSNGSNQTSVLKDQRALSLKDNLDLFVSRYFCRNWHLFCSYHPMKSTNRLAVRLRAGEKTITFDKDDDDTLDFVTSSSNLRSYAYGIASKTRWEVKGLYPCQQ